MDTYPVFIPLSTIVRFSVMMKRVLVSPQLLGSLRPHLLLSRLGGFCPVKIEKDSDGQFVCSFSFHSSVYGYVLATVLFVCSMAGLVVDLTSDRSVVSCSQTVTYVAVMDLGEILVTVFIGMMVVPFKMEHLFRVVHCLGQVDLIVTPQINSKTTVKHLFCACAFIAALLVCDAISWAVKSDFVSVLLHYGPSYIMYFLAFVQQIPYWYLSGLIKGRIIGLNHCLKLAVKDVATLPKSWQPVMTLTNQTIKKINGLTATRLNQLMKANELIEDAIHHTNEFCNIHILMIFLSCLLHLVTTPYFLTTEVHNGASVLIIILEVVWIVAHGCRLMVIVETCQHCLDCYQETIDLVFKLSACEMMDAELKDQVEVFGLQLVGKKVKFSSFSLMKINRSLLTAFAGSVASFLVILFQFGNVERDYYYTKGKKIQE